MVFGNATKPSCFAHFWQGAQSLAPVTRNDIWTSKRGASMWCFVDFDFEMCFAPQRRALLHLSSGQMAPHPPLERAYLSTLRSPKSVRIAGGGAAPSPLHPPTRFYFVTGAPCYLLLFLLLFPSPSTIWVPMCFFLRTSFLVAPPHPLSFCNRRPLLPTPIPFAFFISINDLGSYALLSWSACPPPCTPPPAFIL